MPIRPLSVTPPPSHTHLLSNGRYTVMLTRYGSGYSHWQDLAVTRWREDPTREPWGSYLLLRDEDNGQVWSATRQPYGTESPEDTVSFRSGMASFLRDHEGIRSVLDVAVASDGDIELRRLTLSNFGDRARALSVTSYAELILGPIGADDAHPAFSKMFVQTDWDASRQLLLGTRRRRSDKEAPIWAAQALQIVGPPASDEAPSYETDRALFLGRGHALHHAQSMQAGVELSNTHGCVLDPIFALRRHLTLAPGASVTLLLWTQLADSRESALTLAARINKENTAERLFDDASARAAAAQKQLGIDDAQAIRAGRWLDALLQSDPAQRATTVELMQGRGGSPTLWAAGISGDRPIILLRLGDESDISLLHELLLAQKDWRSKRLAVDVVVLHLASGESAQALHEKVQPLLTTQLAYLQDDAAGPKAELFGLRSDAIGEDLHRGLQTVARVVLGGSEAPTAISTPQPTSLLAPLRADMPAMAAAPEDALEFPNGSGGFVDGGRSYRIDLHPDHPTPAPWINVIANPDFGFLVSAEGGGYSWSLNSQQNPLTPWPNDPVSDSPHDVLYLRDEEDGSVWSATALPIRVATARYSSTHGKGWSRFENNAYGIDLELTQCVPTSDSIKLSRLRLSNRSTRPRYLLVTGYVEWALGANGTVPAPFVFTSRDAITGALLARNPWRADFGERVAFLDMGGQQHSMCGDRREFLGELGFIDRPAALQQSAPLSGRLGAGLDPCGALQTRIELPPNTQLDLFLMLGDAASEPAAQALIGKYRELDFDTVLGDVANQWNGLLDTVQVRTPDRSMDIMLNHWLPYQVLGCRVWARAGYYQASGAFGFRDQLQDVMALCLSRPDLAREHLLRAAGRQFAEGDVQHWWLPPAGRGIRTRISDDRLWLAYVAMHYVGVTGDHAVLDVALPLLAGQTIPAGATDAFFQPTMSNQSLSIYEHCALALDSGLTHGAHGLPLIGTGDWNDGMNAVGERGKGESSWLGWLLLATIAVFTPCAEQRGEGARVQRWRDYATAMREALEQAWDGEWYRRGYYDDGTPLGSRESDECRIDTIAQSWSVMAGAPNPEHAAQAMASVDRLLVDQPNKLAKLFTPPFDHSRENPGYIKGYPPGVRENGGQYTHGATWSIFAWAGLGDGNRAAGLFDLMNPISHSDTPAAVQRYKVEPYALCADVYATEPLVGRGGWTWYTGSAAWLYRAGLEAILGFHRQADQLRIDPCIPKHWPGFELTYLHRSGSGSVTRHDIAVENPLGVSRGVVRIERDGQEIPSSEAIALFEDGELHQLRIVLG